MLHLYFCIYFLTVLSSCTAISTLKIFSGKLPLTPSSHFCVGSRPSTRSCIFQNLYFHVAKKQFEYYSRKRPISFENGETQYNFPRVLQRSKIRIPLSHSKIRSRSNKTPFKMPSYYNGRSGGFLLLHAGGRRGHSKRRRPYDRSYYEPWTAENVDGNLPASSETLVLNSTVLLWEYISPSSFGHTIADNLLPIFIILSTFQEPVESVQLVPMGTCDDYNYFGDTLMWCRHIQGAGGLFFPGFSGQPPISFNTLFTTAKKERKTWIHFPRVIIGGGGLGLWLHYQETPHTPKYMDGGSRGSRGFGVHMWALHQHYYKRFQLNAFCCVMPQHRFTIIDKKGGKGGNTRIGQRRIGNRQRQRLAIGEFPNIPWTLFRFRE
ncbi:hypothetical protein RI054_16g74960 [Pseudoscourfieldia marina]